MKNRQQYTFGGICLGITILLAIVFAFPAPAQASVPHVQFIAQDFQAIFGRAPTHNELAYWAMRRYDKITREALRGAMHYTRAQGEVVGGMPSLDSGSIGRSVRSIFHSVYGRYPTDQERQWWLDRVECVDLMSYRDVFRAMRYHAERGVAVGVGTRAQFCARAEHRKRNVPLNPTLNLAGHPNGPVVRIGLWETGGDVQITSLNTRFFLRLPNGERKYFNAGDIVTVRDQGGHYRVTGPNGYSANITESEAKFSPDPHTGIMVAHNYTNANPALIPCPSGSNRFRGNLAVRRNHNGSRVWLINELRVEEYMFGVTETSNASPTEFQKALAVAARNYVSHWYLRGGRQPHNGFLITNTGNDQVYCGYRFEQNAPRWVENVVATKGQVITYDNQLIASVYFSQSDGRTRSAHEVWNTIRFPYLQGKSDPYGGSTLRGHGVGMSALGALNFARHQGWDYHQILHYYYTGVTIERGY